MNLQSNNIVNDGHVISILRWKNVSVRVYADAATAFKVIALFADDTLVPETKMEILLYLLFPNPQGVVDAIPDIQEFLIYCVRKIAGVDADKENRINQNQIIDWENDEPIIDASLWATYGQSFREISQKVTFVELGHLITCVPHETPLGQALYYRTAKEPKRTKHNQEEIKEFRRMKKFWAIKAHAKEDSGDAAMTDAFHALERAAKHG